MSLSDHVADRATTPDNAAAAQRELDRIRNERFERQMKALLPEGWTHGYIGNLERGHDDRSWFIFAPHPGRVGTTDDRLGGFPTEDRFRLLPLAHAVAFGRRLMAEGR